MRKYFPIYEVAVSHIWLCNCSILNFLIYEENLIFFYIIVGQADIRRQGCDKGLREWESMRGRSMDQNRKCEGGRDKNADETRCECAVKEVTDDRQISSGWKDEFRETEWQACRCLQQIMMMVFKAFMYNRRGRFLPFTAVVEDRGRLPKLRGQEILKSVTQNIYDMIADEI